MDRFGRRLTKYRWTALAGDGQTANGPLWQETDKLSVAVDRFGRRDKLSVDLFG